MDSDGDKERFLKALAGCGTISKACSSIGLTRWSYRKWVLEDHEFSERVDGARADFSESLEDIALDRVRNPDKGKGTDVLLMGLLAANMPQKYRPAAIVDTDSAKELISEWRKAAKQAKEGSQKGDEELSAPIERTLAEILEKRGSSRKDGGVGDQEET